MGSYIGGTLLQIQDSSPERRNLTVTAFSIIIFYLAGAEFNNQEIRLQIINVHFTDPSILTSAVWGVLFWFAFRYWQTFRGRLIKTFHTYVGTYRSQIVCNWYLAIAHKITKPTGDYYIYTQFEKNDKNWILHYRCFKNVTYHEDGTLNNHSESQESYGEEGIDFLLSVFSRLLMYPYIFARAFFFDAEFTSILIPYILFLLAVILGLSSII
jgi:hypothetical protein